MSVLSRRTQRMLLRSFAWSSAPRATVFSGEESLRGILRSCPSGLAFGAHLPIGALRPRVGFDSVNTPGTRAQLHFGPAGKLLGFLVSNRGIKANPKKIKAIQEMEPPCSAREVEKVTGRLAVLSRFLSRSAERALSFFKTLRGTEPFRWTKDHQAAFQVPCSTTKPHQPKARGAAPHTSPPPLPRSVRSSSKRTTGSILRTMYQRLSRGPR